MGTPEAPCGVRGGIRPRAFATCENFLDHPAFRIRIGAKGLTGQADAVDGMRKSGAMSEGGSRNASRPKRLDPILAAASGFPAGDPPVAGIRDRDAPPGHVVSLSDLSDLTGYDRDTLKAWIDKRDMPIQSGGSAGVPYGISVRRFIEWREAAAREEERKKAPSAGTFEGWMGLTDPGKAADAQFKVMRAAEKAGELVPRRYVQDVIARVMNLIRVAVMSIPDRMYREKAGMPEDQRRAWLNESRDHAANALKAAQAELDRAMEALDAARDD